MKIIETYNDISLNTDSKKLIYNKMHDKMHQAIILNLSFSIDFKNSPV